MTVILSAKTYSFLNSDGPVLSLVQLALFIGTGLIKQLVLNLHVFVVQITTSNADNE